MPEKPFANILKLIPENHRISKIEREKSRDEIHEVPKGKLITRIEKIVPQEHSFGKQDGPFPNIQGRPF